MALHISRRDIEQAHSMVRRARDVAKKADMEGMVGQAVQSLEIGSAALGLGYLSGRYGAIGIGPVPADLAAALTLHLGGYLGVAGKYSEHLHNFGDGAWSSYLVKMGAGLGTNARLKSGQSPFTASGENARRYGGMPTMNAGGPLTQAELAAMAQAARG